MGKRDKVQSLEGEQMAPRERFELPWRRPPVVRSEISFFRDHRLTGLDYLGVGYGRTPTSYKPFADHKTAMSSGLGKANFPLNHQVFDEG